MDWVVFAWLKRGSRRKSILKLLCDSSSPLSANEIKNKLNISLSQVSFSLKELCEKELIECLNPQDNIGKIYIISSKGSDLMNLLIQSEN
ncbi:winged helix-turn-helix domain-containing protein [Methanolobus bombayensis]|jgi:predicted transcriptional regulator|uniref:winged helix-turn-helix domain-containing protein n=1 Tax=Methanolobus bombayensis TaxID=38023 RepID=UPI001AE3A523|nr:winged helix-turn-helix domain-containing protein [Methanolobus bombayensis]MBP1910729.1 putative transcriptional regulator [Methanolobus bombayensis]